VLPTRKRARTAPGYPARRDAVAAPVDLSTVALVLSIGVCVGCHGPEAVNATRPPEPEGTSARAASPQQAPAAETAVDEAKKEPTASPEPVAETPKTAEPKGTEVRLTDGDNGKTVTVKAGSDIVVELSSNPSTGHDWVVAEQGARLARPASEFEAAQTARDGAGGIRRFIWKTAGVSGEQTVTLHYRRPQLRDTPPLKTFRFTVRVEP
jgi:predicted secreted protein